MLVEDAATSSSGVWVTFLGIAALYTGVAVTTVLVLRAMRRRFDAADDRSDHSDGGGPYSPRIRPEPVGTGTGTGTGEA
jgi:cytochrome d ubiquinol oxidase subunit I